MLVKPGWLAVYGKEAQGEDANLVPVGDGETVRTEDVEAVGLTTKPPARYNEATLLSAMEGAGKLVDDDELREAMAEKGLGTPATRAAIIEGLLAEKYLLREGRELIPTAKAFQLMTLLRGPGRGGTDFKPELTGEWEYKLSQMEQGALDRQAFMREIAQMTQVIVKRAKEYERDTIPGDYATLKTPCPKCGGVVKENYRRFACTNCDFSIGKIPGGRSFELPEVEELLAKREIGPLQGFRSKMGRPFAAILRISDEYKLEFDFGQNDEDDNEAVDFSGHTPVGTCPKCQSRVFEHGMSYVCEKSVGPEKSCDFRSGKVILQQEISREQMEKLLTDGRTDLLDGFVSSRTNRKFKAFLVRQPDGKIGFEFEPRPEKPGRGRAPAKTAGAATKTAAKKAPAKKAAVKKTATKTATKAATKTATKTAAKKAVKKAAPKKTAA